MWRRAILAMLFGGIAAAQPSPVIRVDVKLVRVLVSVKDSIGNHVGSISRDQFHVFDSGVEQDIAVFERQTVIPLSIALLVDISGSTAKDLHYEIDSVTHFLRTTFGEGNSDDTVALYTFNWQVSLNNGFNRNASRMERSLREVHPEGGTSLYDAIYLAARDLERRDGRHVIVVVTDGGDTTSTKNYHQALESVQMSDTVMYPILVMPITNMAGRNIGGENALTTLAASTGGRVFLPTIGAQLDAAFAAILRDLRTQYLIGYYPKELPASRSRFHPIRVELPRPDLRVSARSGYYGDSSAERNSR